jgi:tRNA pseudouridine38-40 synthase
MVQRFHQVCAKYYNFDPMHRYFVRLSFKGTQYHGWQVQPNAVTVQEVLERAFSTLLGENTAVTGAGRTDTGVHASLYICHLDLAKEIVDPGKLIYRLNSFLPEDISIKGIWKVPADAHARFTAVSRTYKYYINTFKDPFITGISWYYNRKLNLEKMNSAALMLKEYSDFTSFSRLHSDVRTNLCRILFAKWIEVDDKLVFTIKADRFLRNMVRAIVGTLIDVGREKISEKDFKDIIEAKDRCAAGASAPAKGLFLVDIEYPGYCFPTEK